MIILITGPTAVGKTKLSLLLAQKIPHTFIVSVDSRQVYRMMDIGTDKVSLQDRKKIPHYLIDILNPNHDFSLGCFMEKAKKIIDFGIQKKINLIFVGGTVLYALALVKGYTLLPTNTNIRKKLESKSTEELKELLSNLDKKFNTNFLEKYKDRRRIIRLLEAYEITKTNPANLWENNKKFPINKIFILTNNRQIIYENINKRVDRQIREGLIDEVKFILKKFPDAPSFKSMKTFGYYEVIQYLQGNIEFNSMIEMIKKNTRHFAKRQFSFLKKIDGEVINLQDFNQSIEKACDYLCQKLI